MEELLKELKERDKDKLEGQIADLDRTYAGLPALIARTGALTGIDEETLVRCCVQSAWQYKDVSWQLVLDIVRSFYLAKGRIEETPV